MANLHQSDRGPRFPFGRWFLLALCTIGVVLIALQSIYNAGNYLMSWITAVEHPESYKFVALDSVLRQCVKDNLVDYKLLKEKNLLEPPLKELARVSPDKLKDPAEKIAYWANAYNLLVLKAVVDHYPINSVRTIARSMSLHKFVVGGKPYSIEDIKSSEISALISTLDPRTVFLLCGAAQGYPALMDHAFQVSGLQEDMDKATSDFINDKQNVFMDLDSNTLFLSHFFKWYEEPFSRVFKTPADLANAYLPTESQLNLSDPRLKIRYIQDFNWKLNDLAQSTSNNTPILEPAGDTP